MKIEIQNVNILDHCEIIGDTSDREKWLSMRCKGIGGSDVAAIAELNPWRSPLEVYLDKTGQGVEHPDNEAMEAGRDLEPVVLARLQRNLSKLAEFGVNTDGLSPGTRIVPGTSIYQSNDHPIMLATLDGILCSGDGFPEAGIEAKTCGERSAGQWDNGVPDYYLTQVYHYMAVTGLRVFLVPLLIGGREFKVFRVDYDEEVCTRLIELEENFWQDHIMARVPPAVGAMDRAALDSLYPASKVRAEVITLPDEAAELLKAFLVAREEEKAQETEKESACNKLKALMGDAEAAFVGTERISWKAQIQKRLDADRLKKERPEIVKEFQKEIAIRVFRVAENK
jgi:putative phage-type endonuclease